MSGQNMAVISLIAGLVLTACIPSFDRESPTPQLTVGAKIVTPSPAAPRPTSTPKPDPAIVVTAPIAGQLIKSPVRVTGTASVYEATVSIAVKDAAGKVMGKGFTTASAGAPQRGTFSADITFTQPLTAQVGTVEVFSESPKDGSPLDLVAIKVNLAGR